MSRQIIFNTPDKMGVRHDLPVATPAGGDVPSAVTPPRIFSFQNATEADPVVTIDPVTGQVAINGVPVAPGGSDTQVQFNDDGALGGDARFRFDKVANEVHIGDVTAPLFVTVLSNDDARTVDAVGSYLGHDIQVYRSGTANVAGGWFGSNFYSGPTGPGTVDLYSGFSVGFAIGNYDVSSTFGQPTRGSTNRTAEFYGAVHGAAGRIVDEYAVVWISDFEKDGLCTLHNVYGILVTSDYKGAADTLNVGIRIGDFGAGATDYALLVDGGKVALSLPTADPHVVGVLWANAGVVTVSAG